jgi:hypothetical protein
VTEIGVLTRVKDDEGDELRSYLRHLPPRFFSTLSDRTHFARLVVIEFERKTHLLFTSRFDGDSREYLVELVRHPDVLSIWRRCAEPRPLDEASLLRHLLRDDNQVPASYVVALTKPRDTVARINAALTLQTRLSSFALEAEKMSAVELSQQFWELEPVRAVLET